MLRAHVWAASTYLQSRRHSVGCATHRPLPKKHSLFTATRTTQRGGRLIARSPKLGDQERAGKSCLRV
ncbi:hypothetical protein AGOR_G00129150 [Albula goreensis]|uniref:Uncharacterized protein n=1 Tax=Albula goreensis TaxID=1534307 RepID=A0A8T3DB46_9TELE|nr:hypothetical protein AGOR_G00129150 [Albula goreensis]